MEMVRAKRKRVTAREMQDNLERIKESMNYANTEISKTINEMKDIDRNTESGNEKYQQKQMYLQAMMELYSDLQDEQKAEYEILKKYKDSRFYVAPKDLMIITGVAGLAFFMIALERENPKALKLATFVLKLFPIKF